MKIQSEFYQIISNIIYKAEYQTLKKENHHGLTRYDHSLRVAKKTYKWCKKLNLDYVSATRAALLHDFFYNEEFEKIKSKDRYKNHPIHAIHNAQKYYEINGLEEDIIRTHMFPVTTKLPASKEALVVIAADKCASIYEYSRYKFSMQISILLLFIINIITMSNN